MFNILRSVKSVANPSLTKLGSLFILLLIIVDFFTEDYVDDPIFLPLPLLTGMIRIM